MLASLPKVIPKGTRRNIPKYFMIPLGISSIWQREFSSIQRGGLQKTGQSFLISLLN